MNSPTDRLRVNRELWDLVNDQFTDAEAQLRWEACDITWGLFGNLESELSALGPVADRDVLELGCGSAYFGAWLARRGARVVGLDLSSAQLATARRCQVRNHLRFSLLQADAEAVPLGDSTFDLAVSEYGASVWCAPERWVAEVARLLRPGGQLVFLTNSPLVALCVPSEGGRAGDRLLRPLPEVASIAWPEGGVEFHPSHADWVQVLRSYGLVVEALHELYAQPGAVEHPYYEIADLDWATQWPVEDLWVCRKRTS